MKLNKKINPYHTDGYWLVDEGIIDYRFKLIFKSFGLLSNDILNKNYPIKLPDQEEYTRCAFITKSVEIDWITLYAVYNADKTCNILNNRHNQLEHFTFYYENEWLYKIPKTIYDLCHMKGFKFDIKYQLIKELIISDVANLITYHLLELIRVNINDYLIINL